MTKHVVFLPIIDMESAKSDVNGLKEKVGFLLLCIIKWQKRKKCLKNGYTLLLLDQDEVSVFLYLKKKTVQIR